YGADGTTQIVTDDDNGIGACSAIVYNVPAGTYYVEVEKYSNNAVIAAYTLDVNVHSDAGVEAEVNDTQAAANPFMAGAETSDIYIRGDHQVNTDADYYAITVPAGKSIRTEIIEGDAETCESLGVDSRLTLFNAAAA